MCVSNKQEIEKMKCAEINIWINNTSDEELLLPHETVSEHLHVCINCEAKVNAIQQSLRFMNNQKEESLSEEKTSQIIAHLVSRKDLTTTKTLNGRFIISRIAAVLIIAFGLLAGIVAGGLLFADSNGDENPWSTEFTLLSDNTDYMLFE